MDAVERGVSILVTRNGTLVAELRPVLRRRFVATAELMRNLRGLGRTDYAAMRAEADELFGEDRIGD
jgi:antitoxin (DNA-binding transcriptional repressor) of toxin-antitoxin stability system